MADKPYSVQSRIIEVKHPYLKDEKGNPVILFQAYVKIANLKKSLVKKITNVDIKYELQEKN